MEARASFCFPKNTKNPNSSPIGKKFGFCCCGAPPGTRTLGPLIKRASRRFVSIYGSFELGVSASFVRFCNDLHPLHVLKPCKIRAETVHLLPDKLKSTSSDNDLTALVWVAILLFLVLAASQADWKASDLILSITRRFVLEKSNTARYGLYGLVVVSFCQQENNIKRKEKQMMKRIFTLIASIVLATSLLAVPCFAAEPEDLPAPQPGVTETEQPDGSDQPENPDRPSIQPCDAMPGDGNLA